MPKNMWNTVHWNMFVIVKSQKQSQCQWIINGLNVLVHQCSIIPHGCLKWKMSAPVYWYGRVSKNMFPCEEQKPKHRDTGRMGLSIATKAIKNSRSLGMSWFS